MASMSRLGALTVALCAVLCAQPALAQSFSQQGSKLVGTGGSPTGSLGQGLAVAISADRNTAIVGNPDDNRLAGAVWIWTRNKAGGWLQQGAKLVGTGGVGRFVQQGYSVSLSADGNTAAVGAVSDDSEVGAVWIWTRTGTVWSQQGSKLVGTGATGTSSQGWSVALSGDGNTLIVGGKADNSETGAAWVWTRSAGVWTQQGGKLVGSDASGGTSTPQQGWSVAIASDGNTALVGGRGDNFGVGAIWFWTRSGGVWTQQGPKLTASDHAGAALQGASVALAADGNTAIIGGPNDNGDVGAAWVWTRTGGTWARQGPKLIGSGAVGGGLQGFSVSLSADGNTALVGGIADDTTRGATWVWRRNAGTWAQEGSKLVGSGASGPAEQGYAVALSADATTAIVGGPMDANGVGAVWIFTTLAPISLERTSLTFAAVTTGTSFSSSTPPQTVRLSQTGTGTVTWTAASNAPWLTVTPASGTGGALLTVATQFTSGLTASLVGQITLTMSGAANNPGPIAVTLTTVPSTSPPSPPFGVFDTPAGDSTVLAGSVPVTGWALDNIGVQRVELWRDLQPGETTSPFASTPSDPRHGKAFIANASVVSGARPDVESLFRSTPASHRAGWGYLMLTWGLWNQGNGTYTLYAFAFDEENNVATIGTKRIVVNNNAATRPFGSIDTPGVGAEASGPNFGWALTPKVNGAATCRIQSNGVQVSIDSGPLQPVVYGQARADVGAAFPGFSNSPAAAGHFNFDWPTLTNGSHTTGWYVTDDCGRADGIGSRFFTVSNGVSPVMAAPEFLAKPETAYLLRSPVASASWRNGPAVLLARGHGELPLLLEPGAGGTYDVELIQGERIELRLPREFETAFQIGPDGQRRALPAGSTWDATSGIFYWQPAPGFFGRYRLVFGDGQETVNVRITIRASVTR